MASEAITGVLKYGALGLSALLALWTALLLREELNRSDKVRHDAKSLIRMFMFYSIVLLSCSIGIQVYEKWLLDRQEIRAAEKDSKIEFVKTELSSMNTEALFKTMYTLKNQSGMGMEHARAIAEYSDSICEHINRISAELDSRRPSRRCDEVTRLQRAN